MTPPGVERPCLSTPVFPLFSRPAGFAIRHLRVDPADFAIMAENATKDATAATNPRKATKDQIISIFPKAYNDE